MANPGWASDSTRRIIVKFDEFKVDGANQKIVGEARFRQHDNEPIVVSLGKVAITTRSGSSSSSSSSGKRKHKQYGELIEIRNVG